MFIGFLKSIGRCQAKDVVVRLRVDWHGIILTDSWMARQSGIFLKCVKENLWIQGLQGTDSDSFMAPVTIDEKNDSIGACANQTRERCSDKGFLSMPIADYLELLDASARQIRADKTGYTPSDVAPIFERLKLDPDYWRLQIKDFGRLFGIDL